MATDEERTWANVGYLLRMLVKTMDYLDHFARFKRKENVEAVERLLSAHQELAKFERAQLGTYTLLPGDIMASQQKHTS